MMMAMEISWGTRHCASGRVALVHGFFECGVGSLLIKAASGTRQTGKNVPSEFR